MRNTFRAGLGSGLGALLLVLLLPAGAGEPRVIAPDGRKEGKTFEGIGALSAGASSRLLIEYPEPQRSQVLDLLFRPRFGAGFQHLKVEIGGDVNSTDGCEPSHMHERGEENYGRGYEWWLMKEARARNPAVFLDCLEWGAPAWIGNGYFFSQDNADYLARFILGARRVHGLEIQYTGIWNETRPDLGWVKVLRRTLDAAGLPGVQIVATDEVNRWNVVDVLKGDPELARAVQVVGVHYAKCQSPPAARGCGKPLWASEDGPWKGNWEGAAALARLYNRNYVEGRFTKTIVWSPVTSYYDNLPLPGSGVMRANAPWSGAYEVQPALWATAHTTQFAAPGWKYLDEEGCGLLAGGGSYVTLKEPAGVDYSVVIETMDASGPQAVAFRPTGGLGTGPLHVWRSQASGQFVQLSDLAPADGRLELTLEPASIYSLTTTTGQAKGQFEPPPRRPFPTEYRDDFESYAPGATPRYLADQAGIFEVARRKSGDGQCLEQVVERKGIEWHFHLNPSPETFLGDANWCDYEVGVSALLEQEGFVSLFGRVGLVPQNAGLPQGYWLKVDHLGYWELGTATGALASGSVPPRAGWRALKLAFAGTRVQIFIDGARVGEVRDDTYACGMAGVGCGWHRARFDDLAIRVDPSDVNLALDRPATASSAWDADTQPGQATDGNGFGTHWSAGAGRTAGEWLAVDLGQPTTFNQVTLKAFEDRIASFSLQYRNGGEWVDAYGGMNLGANPRTLSFPPVTGTQVRLLVTAARNIPAIREFEVRNRP